MSELMKVEVLMSFKHSDPVTNQLIIGVKEEVKFVSREFCEYGCKMGWLKDLSGEFKTSIPNTQDVVLAPLNSVMGIVSENVNG